MPKGKESIDSKLQKLLGEGIVSLLKKHCQDCKTKEEACEVLTNLTNKEISIKPNTLYFILKTFQAKGKVSNDDFFMAWISKKTGISRGKESIDSKLQDQFGKSLFDLIRENCKSCKTKEEASEILTALTKGKIKVLPLTLRSIIKTALKKEEITLEDFFTSWVIRKPAKKKIHVVSETKSDIEPTKEGIRIRATCQNCGVEKNFDIDKGTFLKMGLAIRGSRCPGCDLWATFQYSVKIDGIEHKGSEKNWRGCNLGVKVSE